MEFIVTYYKELGALIAGLTGFFGIGVTFYSKYRDSNIKDKELELKKEEQKLDRKHQISKEKYQELFNRKIELYEKLYTNIHKFKKQLYDVGRYFDMKDRGGDFTQQELKVEDVNIDTMKTIFKAIDENHFIVSIALMEKYKKLYDLYRNSTKEFEFMYDFDLVDNIDDEWNRIKNGFYKTYKKSIDDFFNQIEIEIKKMKQVIED